MNNSFDLEKIRHELDLGESRKKALQLIDENVIGMGGSYDRIVNKSLTNSEITGLDVERLLGIIRDIKSICIRELSTTA